MIRRKIDKSEESISSANANPFTLDECLAKTYRSPDNCMLAGRTVLSHCHIVGEVARNIMQRMPDWLREKLFPVGSELVAGSHDVGKVSPTFQEKIHRGITGYTPNSKAGLENINPAWETDWGGHAGTSSVTTKAIQAGNFISEVVGQHHGYSAPVGSLLANDEVFGAQSWQLMRESLLISLQTLLKSQWPVIANDTQARAISGLTTVADWIGSSSWFEDPEQSWISSVEKSLDSAGFIAPEFKKNVSFEQVFSFVAHETQTKLIEQVTGPGLYILEAPMGLGKTEAALYAAYQVLAAKKATGLYFALPTQLTSNKIYERVNSFLTQILSDNGSHQRALLLHGNAWLKDTEMGEEGRPGGSWFDSAKRGILAPFAVGTIDQALMAVMNVKHGFVRAFGLAGKVVILDEIHTYDTYTGTIFDRLVRELQALQCTVIILSATLVIQRRHELLGKIQKNQSYPLISSFRPEQGITEVSVQAMKNKRVGITFCEQEKQAIEEALNRAAQGQQVLWIENTVEEAQRLYSFLAARTNEMDVSCGLLHSQFTRLDRMEHEEHWVDLFGKKGVELRNKSGRILVGTQILEQSLDIDADFLITRFCPTDMLLQRLGRLWRHHFSYRPSSAVCEAWILAPSLDCAISNAKTAFRDTAKVYSPYVLCRSLEVWASLKLVMLPGDIRQLLEATYINRHETDRLQHYKMELDKEREKLARFALIGLSKGGTTLPESKASTRYSEIERVDVLLLRAISHEEAKGGTTIKLLNGDRHYLPRNGCRQTRKEWRESAVILTQNIISVAIHKAPYAIEKTRLRSWLGEYFYLGNDSYVNERDESFLRVAIVRESGEIVSLDGDESSKDYSLSYDKELGYQAKKRNQPGIM